jgi:hypothetical protein
MGEVVTHGSVGGGSPAVGGDGFMGGNLMGSPQMSRCFPLRNFHRQSGLHRLRERAFPLIVMKTHVYLCALLVLGCSSLGVRAQTGPFPVTDWPATRDLSKKVHFVVTDDGLSAPGVNWEPGLSLLSGGDQTTEDINIGGFTAKKVTGNYLNVADPALRCGGTARRSIFWCRRTAIRPCSMPRGHPGTSTS